MVGCCLVLMIFSTLTLGIIKWWHHRIIKCWLFDVKFVLYGILVIIFSWDVLIGIIMVYSASCFRLSSIYYTTCKEGGHWILQVPFLCCSDLYSKLEPNFAKLDKLITRMVLRAKPGGPGFSSINSTHTYGFLQHHTTCDQRARRPRPVIL